MLKLNVEDRRDREVYGLALDMLQPNCAVQT